MKSEASTIEMQNRFDKQRHVQRDITQCRFSMEPHSLPSKLLLQFCSQHTLVTDYLHTEEDLFDMPN